MIVRLAIFLLLLATLSSLAEDSSLVHWKSAAALRRKECARNVMRSAKAVKVRTLAPCLSYARPPSRSGFFMEQLREGLTVGHPDMPTFRFTREDARAFLLYLRSIQAP